MVPQVTAYSLGCSGLLEGACKRCYKDTLVFALSSVPVLLQQIIAQQIIQK